MNHTIKLKKAQVREILKATFPDYKGRKYKIEFTEQVRLHDTNWSGGTKNEYVAIGTNGQTSRPTVGAPWDNQVEGQVIELPAHIMIVKHHFFCGSDMGITIYANPCHLPKYLMAGN